MFMKRIGILILTVCCVISFLAIPISAEKVHYFYDENRLTRSDAPHHMVTTEYNYDDNGNLIDINSRSDDTQYALEFDGTEDIVDIGVVPEINFTTEDFTFEAWINLANVAGVNQRLISAGYHPHEGWEVLSNQGRIILRTYDGTVHEVRSNGVLSENKWTHIAVVKEGSDARIYVNGKEHTETVDVVDPEGYNGPVVLGGYTNGDYHFAGKMKEVRVWEYARTETAVQAGMNANLAETELGLAGYWRMREGSGSRIYDFSPNRHHGTIQGATWNEARYALLFDGAENQVNLGIIRELNFTTADFTYEAWINLANVSGINQRIISAGKHPSEGWEVLANQGQIILRTYDGTVHETRSNKVMNENEWTHIAVVKEGITARIYVNGQEHTESVDVIHPSSYERQVVLGGYANGGYHFAGKIKEVRVWNYARTETVIQSDKNTILTGTESGLAGYWRLKEGIGSRVYDYSSNRHHGTIQGAAWDEGRYVLKFDGIQDQVNLGEIPEMNFTTEDFTYEAWINQTDLAGVNQRLISAGKYPDKGWEVFANQGQIILRTYDGTVHETRSNSVIQENEWTHIAVMKEESDARIYVNGVDQTETVDLVDPVSYDGQVVFGGYINGGYHFTGGMKDVRVWAYPRTESEIQDEMSAILIGTEPGLTGYWKLEEGSGDSVYDSSPIEHHGIMHGAIWDEAQYALQLDGEGDTINLGINPKLNFTTGDFTFEAWISQEDLADVNQRIISAGKHPDRGWEIFANQGKIILRTYDGTVHETRSIPVIQENEWTHIAVVKEERDARIYVNGQEQTDTVDVVDPVSYDGQIVLGGYTNGGYHFAGKLKGIRVWEYARSETEIQDSMNANLTGGETGLVSNWRLDEAEGTNLFNNWSKVYDGAILGAEWVLDE